MNLRIIAGTLKGRVIRIPEKQVSFRPTLERARQSIADMLTPLLPGCSGADLCAGSGAFGFEMISRGAKTVDFVENDRLRAESIRATATTFGIQGQCRIIMQGVAAFAASESGPYDIIFFDPPYDDAGMADLVPSLMRRLNPNGILLFQRRRVRSAGPDRESRAPEVKIFGDTAVEIHRFRGNATIDPEY